MKNITVVTHAVSLVSGAIMGYGLVISGMTSPDKVRGFLNIFGEFDPSLGFVMLGALCVSTLGFRLLQKRDHPLFAGKYDFPNIRSPIDIRLILGSILFGLGWGISGLCPAPAIGSLVMLDINTLIFVVSLIGGIIFTRSFLTPTCNQLKK